MPLFPTLAHAPCGYLSINELAKADPERLGPDKKSRYLDPDYAWKKIQAYHERASIAWSYGEYLCPRDVVWEGIDYLKERDTYLHLGWDFNVPAGTPISLTRPGTVVLIDNDTPEPYGWGTRVVVALKAEPIYLIFAHLDENVSCRKGQELRANTMLGSVGAPPFNGGWYPHAHIQSVVARAWPSFLARLSELDGYGKLSEQSKLARTFPDPLPYVRVW